ncbi:MAG: long-chain fatty acid--CoA ligase [Pleurocapsa minor GSE-CHR-MK-17-07R]|jgi:fatty-acyl-CoA synthase|nr:long-chain fatty acid--CoA ligase [Pleurocapsa minor GSE-CHR-MK 17-07R]
MPILASDWIAFHADRTPDKLAMVDEATGRQFTYAQMNDRAARLAGYLREAWGVQPGDRIAILAKNSTDYFELQYACSKLGAMMLPLNWRLAEQELRFILGDAGALGIVYDGEFAPRIPGLLVPGLTQRLRLDFGAAPADDAPAYEDALVQTSLRVGMSPLASHDDPMMIMYTAGTTGRPKGVLITHGMMLWNAVNMTTPTGLSHDSVFYCVLPTFHIGGLNLYANPVLHLGGTNIIARQFDAGRTLEVLSDPDTRVTHMFGVPSIYLFLSQHADFEAADLSRVHSWGCGGAPMPVPVLETYARRGIVIQLGFGMTETSPTVFLTDKRRALAKPTSVGKPLQHTRVRVVRDDFTDVAAGEVGEVVIAGPNVTPGYWQRPDANAESFTTDAHGQRWLHSGDAGTIDEEGCIYIVDRYKDMYISGGENVYPAEVEQILYQIEGVAEAAVIGIPDAKWGECGLAVVVTKPGVTLDSSVIIAYCQTNLARFKVPKQVEFIEALPRNAAGKVLKRELRTLFVRQPS